MDHLAQYEKMASIVKSMAHPIRMQILLLLSQHQELSVSELVQALGLEQTLISQHLQKMKLNGFLNSERRGKFIFYQLKSIYLVKIIKLASKILQNKN